jgi:transposase
MSTTQEAAMLRSRTVNTIHELLSQGKSIRHIAATLELSRNTVRKYLHGTAAPEATPRPRRKRGSKLDSFKQQIAQWIKEDHLYNCATMLPRLRSLGYRGSATLLRDFVHPLRPRNVGHQPVMRYETKAGEQMQYDWGEFVRREAA